MNIFKTTSVLVFALGLSAISSANETMTVTVDAIQAAISPPTVDAVQKDGNTVLTSPRTGATYTLKNPTNLPVTFQTELLAPATALTADRIVATNPALSTVSQEKAKAALIEMVAAPVASAQ